MRKLYIKPEVVMAAAEASLPLCGSLSVSGTTGGPVGARRRQVIIVDDDFDEEFDELDDLIDY